MGDGIKHDADKVRMDLVPWQAVREIAKVLTFGAKKYGDYNWQGLDDPQARLFGALQRHLLAWWDGDDKDDETGISHLAHAGCCILFLLWFELPHRAFSRGRPAQASPQVKAGQEESDLAKAFRSSQLLRSLTHF